MNSPRCGRCRNPGKIERHVVNTQLHSLSEHILKCPIDQNYKLEYRCHAQSWSANTADMVVNESRGSEIILLRILIREALFDLQTFGELALAGNTGNR